MAATRIFRWADAPLPWRLMLAALSGDSDPRTHLAAVPSAAAGDWADLEQLPAPWTDAVSVEIEDADGLAGIRSGDLLIAGNELQP